MSAGRREFTESQVIPGENSRACGSVRYGRCLAFLFLVATLISALPAAGVDLELKTLEGENLRLIYFGDESYIVPHLTRSFQNSLRFHKRLFGYEPSEKINIILQDMDDHGYAGTTTMPHNYLTLGIEPFEHVYETCPTNERISWVMNHELVHIVASDMAVVGMQKI